MRNTLIAAAAAAAALLAGGSAHAAPSAGVPAGVARPATGKPVPMDPAMVQRRIEITSLQVATGIFRQADANHDGRISKAEMDAYARRSGVPGGIDAKAWARTDVNHDGYATLPELAAAIRYSMTPQPAAKPMAKPASAR